MQYDAPYEITKRSGDAGYDLRAMEDVVLKQGEPVMVETGARFNFDEDMAGLLLLRSSMGARGVVLLNSVGVIDSSYNGPGDTVRALIMKVTDGEPVKISKGERFCQMVFAKISSDEMERGEWEQATDRSGFGSTGT